MKKTAQIVVNVLLRARTLDRSTRVHSSPKPVFRREATGSSEDESERARFGVIYASLPR